MPRYCRLSPAGTPRSSSRISSLGACSCRARARCRANIVVSPPGRALATAVIAPSLPPLPRCGSLTSRCAARRTRLMTSPGRMSGEMKSRAPERSAVSTDWRSAVSASAMTGSRGLAAVRPSMKLASCDRRLPCSSHSTTRACTASISCTTRSRLSESAMTISASSCKVVCTQWATSLLCVIRRKCWLMRWPPSLRKAGFAAVEAAAFHQQHVQEARVVAFELLARHVWQLGLGLERTHQARRDDHQQLLVVALDAVGLEEGAEHRDVAQEGELVDAADALAADQPADDEGLAIAQRDGGFGAAHAQTGDVEAADLDRQGRVDLADFGRDLQRDALLIEHRGRQAQSDAEFLELDRDGAVRARAGAHGDGQLAASQEGGCLAAERGQAGLGHRVGEAVAFQCAEHRQGVAAPGEDVERVGSGQEAAGAEQRPSFGLAAFETREVVRARNARRAAAVAAP